MVIFDLEEVVNWSTSQLVNKGPPPSYRHTHTTKPYARPKPQTPNPKPLQPRKNQTPNPKPQTLHTRARPHPHTHTQVGHFDLKEVMEKGVDLVPEYLPPTAHRGRAAGLRWAGR